MTTAKQRGGLLTARGDGRTAPSKSAVAAPSIRSNISPASDRDSACRSAPDARPAPNARIPSGCRRGAITGAVRPSRRCASERLDLGRPPSCQAPTPSGADRVTARSPRQPPQSKLLEKRLEQARLTLAFRRRAARLERQIAALNQLLAKPRTTDLVRKTRAGKRVTHMFSKPESSSQDDPSVEPDAEGVEINGDVVFTSHAIDCRVHGTSRPPSRGKAAALLVLSTGGWIAGSLRCGDAVLNGRGVGTSKSSTCSSCSRKRASAARSATASSSSTSALPCKAS